MTYKVGSHLREQYDLVHVSHKVVKGEALADFLADHALAVIGS